MKNSLLHSLTFFLSLILLFVSISVVPVCGGQESTEVKEPDNLYALSACLMDADSGRVLFEKNGEEKRANASTTKTMTLIVTLENADLDDIVTVSEYAARQPDVQLNINTGEQYLLRDLCYSLMLESHNDSAVAIAEHVGGSVEDFAKLMNQKAQEIGCTNTHFVTPNGLDASDEGGDHGTTAEDLAKILSYCVKKSPKSAEFLEITRTPSYSFRNKKVAEDGTISNGNRSFSCNNHNAFLNMMEGALSGKTGFTGNAGYCYVGALESEGRTFVVALLGCGWPNNKTYKWSDTKKLMQYGIENYQPVVLEEQKKNEELPKTVLVTDAKTADYSRIQTVPVEVIEDTSVSGFETLLLRKDEKVELECNWEHTLEAPLELGTVVGRITYRVNGEVVKKEKIVCGEYVEKCDFSWGIERILERFFL